MKEEMDFPRIFFFSWILQGGLCFLRVGSGRDLSLPERSFLTQKNHNILTKETDQFNSFCFWAGIFGSR